MTQFQNSELAARAWLILGSLVVGVQIILRVVKLVSYAPFMKLTNGNLKNFCWLMIYTPAEDYITPTVVRRLLFFFYFSSS